MRFVTMKVGRARDCGKKLKNHAAWELCLEGTIGGPTFDGYLQNLCIWGAGTALGAVAVPLGVPAGTGVAWGLLGPPSLELIADHTENPMQDLYDEFFPDNNFQ